jgi:predicted DNA-binding transcriptional regulator AlpA
MAVSTTHPLENVIVKNSPKASTPGSSPARPLPVCPLVNGETLAQYLGISPRSIRRLVSEGKIPAPLRFSGSPRWNLKLIESWVWGGCKATPKKGSR